MNNNPHAACYDANGNITKVIVGDFSWAQEALGGGTWVDCGDARPDVTWKYVEGVFQPPSPNNGWEWDGSVWVAPKPMPSETPEGGGCWDWDDDNLDWIWRPAEAETSD